MIKSIALSLYLIFSCSVSANEAETTNSLPIHINQENITVSGISSGAYMATQFHIAHSENVSGAALLAGGPYYCAQNSIQTALGSCMKNTEAYQADAALSTIQSYLKQGLIDDTSNLANDKVWIFHGKKDLVMSENMSKNSGILYKSLGTTNIVEKFDIDSNHGFPTVSKGVACDSIGSPFLNACGYDAAEAIFKNLYGELIEKQTASGKLIPIDQSDYNDSFFLESGYLYVPNSCSEEQSCILHIVFHGCKQSTQFVENSFIENAGYNEWAESNNIIVFYPQISSSLMNPNGCWDWWGYTGSDYSNKKGSQIKAIFDMVNSLTKAKQ